MDVALKNFVERNRTQLKENLVALLDGFEAACEISQALYELGYEGDEAMAEVIGEAASDDEDLLARIDRMQKLLNDGLLQSEHD